MDEENHRVHGIITDKGDKIHSSSVVLTTGTFLGGVIWVGHFQMEAGRFGDAAATAMSKTLAKYQFPLGRLKTGTPPRLDKNTINYEDLVPQGSDNPPEPFSYGNSRVHLSDQLVTISTVVFECLLIFLFAVKATMPSNIHHPGHA